MKKIILLISILLPSFIGTKAQNALGAYGVSQPDLKGTARFMGMAGAFGALGGDLSAISVNPGGIGVYRSSDIGFTLDLDAQKSTSQVQGSSYDMSQTKFLLNNIGAVLTLRLASNAVPNLNFGFTYNKGASFNRVLGGDIPNLGNSMSNYVAGIANTLGVTEGDVSWDSGVDPYNPGLDYFQAPWMTILSYDSYLINPDFDPSTGETRWSGLWMSDKDSMSGTSTKGSGSFLLQEWGSTNDYNIVIGGNIANIVYWGMNFDIVNMNYQLNTVWGERLTNAVVPNGNSYAYGNADWKFNSLYTMSATGFNYQLGFIVKPVQQFRLGFAFHTPTWYNINEEFSGSINYDLGDQSGQRITNDGYPGYTSYNFRTPWKIIASAAGVLGDKLIVSFDYEWANYGSMHFSQPRYYDDYYYGYDPWDPWPYAAQPASYLDYINSSDPYGVENAQISTYYKSSNTYRIGVEFKPISALSIRAGYSNVSSPVKYEAQNNQIEIATGSLTPSYRFDNSTNYITCGLGFRYQHVYVDLAYVYKHMSSEYHAFSPDTYKGALPSPQAKLSLVNNQVVLSAGYRF